MTKHSLDETLIEVWRQTLVENAKAVKVGRESLSDPPSSVCDRWISYSTETRFEDWSRTRTRNPVGHKWHDPAKRWCSSSAKADT